MGDSMSSSSPTAADRFLPAPLTAFVGRERELAGLRALLARRDVRLLTVTGPGGVGKTRLAIEAARELADGFAAGVRFVPLAPLGSPDLVLPAIARTLGIGESHPGGILRDLTEQLASTELLLVLDNFEHLLAAGPDLALLLAACPALTLLVTSRAALRVSGEHEFAVPPLPLPVERGTWTFEQIAASDAVRLFVERAEAVQAGFRLTPANAWDAAEICRRLDGLPLAIELAAARVKVFPPHALLARLERRLPLLTGGPRDAPARLRTMRDAIAWSHDLLDADEQRLFRRLAVFVGGFTLDAAIDVAGDGTLPEAAVVEGISSLVDKSLLLPAASDDAANDDLGEPRFSMLETVREFALDELARSGEEDAVRRAHAEYFRALGRARRARAARRRPGRLDRATRNGAAEPARRAGLVAGRRRRRDRTAPRRRALLVLVPPQPRRRGTHLVRSGAGGRREPAAAAGKAALGAGMLAWRAGRVCDVEGLLRGSPGAVRGVRRPLGHGRCRPPAGTPGRGPGARRGAVDRAPRRLPGAVRGDRRRLGRRLLAAVPRPGVDGRSTATTSAPPPC